MVTPIYQVILLYREVNIERFPSTTREFPMRGLAIVAISAVMGVTVIGLVGITLMSGGNSAQQPWQVVRNNVTVTGPIGTTIVCGIFAASCVPECCTSIDNN